MTNRCTWDMIQVYLTQIDAFYQDPSVTEIMVNGDGHVFIQREGLDLDTGVWLDPADVEIAIGKIANLNGMDIDGDRPTLEARMADGTRVSAILPPISVDGPALDFRKFGQRYTLAQLVSRAALTHAAAEWLSAAVRQRRNILISGATGDGKTTLLNALVDTVDDRQRIFLIESTSEIHLHKPNLVRTQSRTGEGVDGRGPRDVTIAHLVSSALRFKPARIILGEVRGAEAWDLLFALNTGHRGSFCTIHGNSAGDALDHLSLCVLQSAAGRALPHAGVCRAIKLAFQVLVHVATDPTGRRHVAHILELTDYTGDFVTREVYADDASSVGVGA